MSTLERAIEIAASAHAGQTDKGGQPYILHPLRVMMRGASPEERIAAVLHDVVEDSRDWQLSDLRAEGFGDAVCDAVDALTRREGEEYAEYITRAGANAIARAVKLADLRDNLSPERIEQIAQPGDKLVKRYTDALTALSPPQGDQP